MRGFDSGCHFKILVVATVEGYYDGVLSCSGLSPKQHFSIENAPEIENGFYTFFGFEKVEDLSSCKFVDATGPFQKLTIVDLCSGMGGLQSVQRCWECPLMLLWKEIHWLVQLFEQT